MVVPGEAHTLVLRHDKRTEVVVTRFHSPVGHRRDLDAVHMVVVVAHSILGSDLDVDIVEEVRVDNRLVYMVVVPSSVFRT